LIGRKFYASYSVSGATRLIRHRGLLLDPSGPDGRQVGSVFLNLQVTATKATHRFDRGCPVHQGSSGELRASAGWLLEFAGCHPGQAIAEGVRCSERRTLTITAHAGATAAGFDQALAHLAARAEIAPRATLPPEPTRVGRLAAKP
ncbi:hypothetical protein ACFQ87_45150, partial [Kitasatospora sp. NPDC056531]